VRAAGYWHLGAWVVGRGDVQSGPVELQVSESVWTASCPEWCRMFWWGCRRVSPSEQSVVWRCAVGCLYSCCLWAGECGVVLQFVEDHVGLLAPSCCAEYVSGAIMSIVGAPIIYMWRASSGVTSICGIP
jgi:hypothetical protein